MKGKRSAVKEKLVVAIMTIITLPILLPYLWLLLNSLAKGVYWGLIPQRFTLENWSFLWRKVKIGANVFPSVWPIVGNTVLLAGGITVLVVLIASLTGYALSRINFTGKSFLLKATIFLHAFPGVALLIAMYFVLQKLGLIDTLLGVILVKVALELPMATWIIKGFFDNIPLDTEWAAYLDGCNRFQAWWKVILPQMKTGLAAIAIFSFISGWSEFIYVYTFIYSPANYTLAVYLKNLIGDFRMLNYNLLCATGLFYMIPVILFFVFSQKTLMQISFGGLKE